VSPDLICRMVYEAGMTLRLRDDNLVLTPASRLTPDLRALLLEHKFAVIQFLEQAHATTAAVVQAAMRVCDLYADGLDARADMNHAGIRGGPLG
jgi:TubC N-terminal docking domain